MVTLFEAFDNKYKYDVISVLVTNSGFSEKVQNLCFENGIIWVHNVDTFFDFSMPMFCLDICLREGRIYLSPCSDGRLLLSHWQSHGYTVDPKLYKEEDFGFLSNILKYGNNVPSYKPKRVERTLEKRNNMDEAFEVWMVVNSNDELERVREGMESIDGYRWPTSVDVRGYPFYIFANLVNRDVTYAYHTDMMTYAGENMDITKSYVFDNVYKLPYTIKTLKHFLKVLTDGKITPTPKEEPSYEPRRVNRTLESAVSGYRYDTIVFKAADEDESVKIQTGLFENGYGWMSCDDKIQYFDEYPVYFFAKNNGHFISYINNRLLRQFDGEIMDYISHSNSRGNNMCEKVYGFGDVSRVEYLMKNGGFTPSYEPRRTERTLESIDDTYLPFRVWCDNSEKAKEFEKYMCDDLGWRWRYDDNNIRLIRNDPNHNSPETFCRFNKKRKTFDAFSFAKFDDYVIYTFPEDMNKIRIVFGDAPSYEPKKIKRTLESSLLESIGEYLPFRVWCDDREKSIEFEDLLYVNGWKWDYQDPNARLIRDDENSDTNTFCYFDGDKKTFDSYGGKVSDGYILYEYPTDLDKIRDYIIKKPSYGPRKIERTLEGLESDIIPILVFCPTSEDCMDFEKHMHRLGFRYPGGTPNYIIRDRFSHMFNLTFFKFNKVDKTMDVRSGDNFNDGKKFVYPKDISVIDRYFGVTPSYEPKRTKRTLESVGNNMSDIYIWADTRRDSLELEKFIHGLGYDYRTSEGRQKNLLEAHRNIDEVTFFDFDLKEKTFRAYGSRQKEGDVKMDYPQDKDKIRDALISRPSYKPRKITRTLESFDLLKEGYIVEGVQTHDEYSIEVDSEESSVKIQEYLFSEGYKWTQNGKSVRPMEPGNIITCYKSTRELVWAEDIWQFSGFVERGWRHNSKLYTMGEWDEFSRLVSNRPNQPSYEPRRTERTLESFNIKDYPYNSVAFNVSGRSDVEKIITFFYTEHGIENNNDLDFIIKEIEDAFRHGEYAKRCLIVSFKINTFFILMPESFSDYNTNPKIYTARDLGEFGLRPSYEPKRIRRTLEGVEHKQHYDEVVFKVDDKEQYTYVLKYLFDEAGYSWYDTDRDLAEVTTIYPVYLFTELSGKQVSWGNVSDIENIESYITANNNDDSLDVAKINPHIFNYRDVNKLDSIRRGMRLEVPNYEPKKVKRTLESINSKEYPYKKIVIRVNNREEFDKFESFLRETTGIDKMEIDHVDLRVFPNFVFFYIEKYFRYYKLETRVYETSSFEIERALEYIDNHNSELNKRIFTVNDSDLYYIRQIIINKNEAPNYNPKKIERTLESYGDMMDVNTTNYFKEYNTLVFSIKPEDKEVDITKFMRKMEMVFHCGLDNTITQYVIGESKRTPQYIRFTFEGGFEWGYSDLGAFPEMARRNNHTYKKIFSFDDVKDYFMDILTRGDVAPNYSPKKIERTLESHLNPIDMMLCKYFKEYNTLVFSVTSEDTENEVLFFDNMKRIFKGGFYDQTIERAIERSKTKPQYFRITLDGIFDYGISNLEYFPKNAVSNNFTYKKIFSYNDIKNNFYNILTYGDIVPNYEPRKVKRTLEGQIHYPYRFKTEQEFIDSYGEEWRDYVYDNGPNWCDEMDYLFGEDFPFEDDRLHMDNDTYPIDERWHDPRSDYGWMISWIMLTKNRPKIPSYEPKKTNRTLDEGSTWYPYRFKTGEEMIKKYGYDWRDNAFPGFGWNNEMNHLLGKDFPFPIDELDLDSQNNEPRQRLPLRDSRFVDEHGWKWVISWDMLTRNRPDKPSYEPKKIIKTLESKLSDNINGMLKNRLSKGKYTCINFGFNNKSEAKRIKVYIDSLGIFENTVMLKYDSRDDGFMCKTIFTIENNRFDAFYLYNSGEGDHMTDGSFASDNPEYTISPIFTPDEFIRYIESYRTPNYEPKRIQRTLESVGDDFWKRYERYRTELKRGNIYLYVRANNGREIDDFYKMLKSNEKITFVGLDDETIESFVNTTFDEDDTFYFSFKPNDLGGFSVGYLVSKKIYLNTYPEWMMDMKDSEMIRLLFGVNKKPSYEPRRIDRTFEKFHEKYKYGSIVIAIHSMAEMDEARKYIGKMDGFNSIYDRFNEKGFTNGGYYVRINERHYDKVKHLTYSELSHLDPPNSDPDSYERLLTINELRRGVLDSIFNRGNSLLTPTYTPRKINRSFESFVGESFVNKYKHDLIIVKVETSEESEKMQNLFFRYGIKWGSGHDTPIYLEENFPDYLVVSLGTTFGSPCITHGEKPTREAGIWNDDNMDWNVYTINDYEKIHNILQHGKNIEAPSYKPRKMDRTLESKKNI